MRPRLHPYLTLLVPHHGFGEGLTQNLYYTVAFVRDPFPICVPVGVRLGTLDLSDHVRDQGWVPSEESAERLRARRTSFVELL